MSAHTKAPKEGFKFDGTMGAREKVGTKKERRVHHDVDYPLPTTYLASRPCTPLALYSNPPRHPHVRVHIGLKRHPHIVREAVRVVQFIPRQRRIRLLNRLRRLEQELCDLELLAGDLPLPSESGGTVLEDGKGAGCTVDLGPRVAVPGDAGILC
ncbi:hypothetical protein BU23DRAFT_166121 [Bimuria novae-zelandiae CBS 107.79]|uniref:Uncharacterized protein n=1 Tax=Bimuria novae-zelandiae CBS 107.79 TaxID=1447943 RepID=A0A6A5V5H0_9PLEO|nr:hypothetical protein BU23DRAFT_166121 [Bimuria novae-zelandiae CBS 107.79]